MGSGYEILIFVVVWIISAVIKHFTKGAQDREMKELADRLSLDFDDGGILGGSRVAGIFEGREVFIANFYQGNKRDRQLFYKVQMMHDFKFPEYIRVYNSVSFGPVSGLLTELSEFFGAHDIEFDNSVFNQKFVIRARNEGIARQIIDDAAQESLISLGNINLFIEEGQVYFIEEGNAASHENKIRTKLYLLARIVSNISDLATTGAFDKVSRVKHPAKPQTKPQYAFSVQNSRPTAQREVSTDDGSLHITSLKADIVPQRSDYYPEPVSPEEVVRQMKREGYYTGD